MKMEIWSTDSGAWKYHYRMEENGEIKFRKEMTDQEIKEEILKIAKTDFENAKVTIKKEI